MIYDFDYNTHFEDIVHINEEIELVEEKYYNIDDYQVKKYLRNYKDSLQYKFIIEYYTFFEQLTKNIIYYSLLNNNSHENSVNYIDKQLGKKKFSPPVRKEDLQNLKYYISEEVFFFQGNCDFFKTHDEIIEYRHSLAHTGYRKTVLAEIEYPKAINMISTYIKISEVFLSNKKKHLELKINYNNLFELFKAFNKLDKKTNTSEKKRKMQEIKVQSKKLDLNLQKVSLSESLYFTNLVALKNVDLRSHSEACKKYRKVIKQNM